jgi:hypothetical protein
VFNGHHSVRSVGRREVISAIDTLVTNVDNLPQSGKDAITSTIAGGSNVFDAIAQYDSNLTAQVLEVVDEVVSEDHYFALVSWMSFGGYICGSDVSASLLNAFLLGVQAWVDSGLRNDYVPSCEYVTKRLDFVPAGLDKAYDQAPEAIKQYLISSNLALKHAFVIVRSPKSLTTARWVILSVGYSGNIIQQGIDFLRGSNLIWWDSFDMKFTSNGWVPEDANDNKRFKDTYDRHDSNMVVNERTAVRCSPLIVEKVVEKMKATYPVYSLTQNNCQKVSADLMHIVTESDFSFKEGESLMAAIRM